MKLTGKHLETHTEISCTNNVGVADACLYAGLAGGDKIRDVFLRGGEVIRNRSGRCSGALNTDRVFGTRPK